MNRPNRFQPWLTAGAVLLSLSTFALVAAAKLSKTGTSSTSFKAAGPAGMNITGSTADMSIADDGTTITITVPLANLDTGIALRNEHTKKALETDKFPNVTLAVARSALKFPDDGASSSGDAKGSMTLHGQTKNVTFHYAAKRAGNTYSVTGSTTVNVDDFGVNRPSYLGVTVKPDVGINTAFQAND